VTPDLQWTLKGMVDPVSTDCTGKEYSEQFVLLPDLLQPGDMDRFPPAR